MHSQPLGLYQGKWKKRGYKYESFFAAESHASLMMTRKNDALIVIGSLTNLSTTQGHLRNGQILSYANAHFRTSHINPVSSQINKISPYTNIKQNKHPLTANTYFNYKYTHIHLLVCIFDSLEQKYLPNQLQMIRIKTSVPLPHMSATVHTWWKADAEKQTSGEEEKIH